MKTYSRRLCRIGWGLHGVRPVSGLALHSTHHQLQSSGKNQEHAHNVALDELTFTSGSLFMTFLMRASGSGG